MEQKRAVAHFLELVEEDTKQRVLEGRQRDRDVLLNSDLTVEEIEEELLEDEARYLEYDKKNAFHGTDLIQYWKQFR